MRKKSFTLTRWSAWRVIVQSTVTGEWKIWAAFVIETEAHAFCIELDKNHNDWNARVLHPDSEMPKNGINQLRKKAVR